MTKYLIQSRAFSTRVPAYAFVDDDKYPLAQEVVCYAGQAPGNIGHWEAVPSFPGPVPFYYLQLTDNTQRQATGDPFLEYPVVVGPPLPPFPNTIWDIQPPLSEGDANTPRTIGTIFNDGQHASEWTIHGDPYDDTIPKSFVRIQRRTLKEPLDPKSVWYFIPVD